jgi:hypothetical protein
MRRKLTRTINKPQLIIYSNKGEFKSVPYETIDQKTVWELTKKYINNLKVNKQFGRSNLLRAVYELEVATAYGQRECAADSYRRALEKVGCIEFVSRGIYKKIKPIPLNLTTNKLQEAAYDSSWRTWFIPLEERFKNE